MSTLRTSCSAITITLYKADNLEAARTIADGGLRRKKGRARGLIPETRVGRGLSILMKFVASLLPLRARRAAGALQLRRNNNKQASGCVQPPVSDALANVPYCPTGRQPLFAIVGHFIGRAMAGRNSPLRPRPNTTLEISMGFRPASTRQSYAHKV